MAARGGGGGEGRALRHQRAVAHSVDLASLSASPPGYRSNDAESEVARLKHWIRMKYGFVRESNAKGSPARDKALLRKLAEYMFYTNVGSDIASIMKALRYFSGVTGKPAKF